jgi:hypothetical protein
MRQSIFKICLFAKSKPTYPFFTSLHLTPTYSSDLQESDHFMKKNTLDKSFYSCEVNLRSCMLTFNYSLRLRPLSTPSPCASVNLSFLHQVGISPSIGSSHISWPRRTCSSLPSSRTRLSNLVCALPDHFPTTLTFLTYLPSVDI